MEPCGTLTTRFLRLAEISIPYHWGYGVADCLAETAAGCGADRFIIVTDQTVGELYAARFRESLSQLAPTSLEVVNPAGDGAKTWANLSALCNAFVRAGATRQTCIVALGGGSVGNVAGLAAALTFRGLQLVHVPTTLVAAFDSVISLKQAINSCWGKNHFGTFHRPAMIFTDLKLLESLPEREVLSGIGEVIKNVLAIKPEAFDTLAAYLPPDARREVSALKWFLEISIEAKMEVMRDDARECRRGVLLEYGHTVGHAIEFLDSQRRGPRGISHGEAVALGMLVASEVSMDVLEVHPDLVARHRYLLSIARLEDRLPGAVSTDAVLALVRKDNKRGYIACTCEEAPMVLLRGLGEPSWQGDYPLTSVRLKCIEKALSRVQLGDR
jgi:3-dehydroquinate synthetase